MSYRKIITLVSALISFIILVVGFIADDTNTILAGIGFIISDYVWMKINAQE